MGAVPGAGFEFWAGAGLCAVAGVPGRRVKLSAARAKVAKRPAQRPAEETGVRFVKSIFLAWGACARVVSLSCAPKRCVVFKDIPAEAQAVVREVYAPRKDPERATMIAAASASGGRQQGVFAMGDLFQPSHLILIAIIVIVFFGGRKLPELGKGLGEGLRGFKEGMKGISDEPTSNTKPGETAHTVTPKADEAPKPPASV
jgi:sec-independent protein translocase protein TatA